MGKRRGTPRDWERRANNQRAAWNRIGKAFKIASADLAIAKKNGLSPYRILRHMAAYNRDSVIWYIQNLGQEPLEYESFADYAVDREIARLTEIARLEEEGFSPAEALEAAGEFWY